MIITGIVECTPSRGTFGCIIGSDGNEYLFDGGYAIVGTTVTFEKYLIREKFLRAIDIKNHLQILEEYYWVIIGKRTDSDEAKELEYRLELLKDHTMDISKSRTAKIAMGKLQKCT